MENEKVIFKTKAEAAAELTKHGIPFEVYESGASKGKPRTSMTDMQEAYDAFMAKKDKPVFHRPLPYKRGLTGR